MASGRGLGWEGCNHCSTFLSVSVKDTRTKRSLGKGIVYLGDTSRLQSIIERKSRHECQQIVTAYLLPISGGNGYTHASCLLSGHFIYFDTDWDSMTREWYHPQWVFIKHNPSHPSPEASLV